MENGKSKAAPGARAVKTYVCGHRNPDVDSVASAYALADLRRRTSPGADIEAICAGRLPPRAKRIFDRFGLEPPRAKSDVYVRVRDLIAPDVPIIPGDTTLLTAVRTLAASGESSLAVADGAGRFAGMLSPLMLLPYFFEKKDVLIPVVRAPLHVCGQVLAANDRVHDVKASAIRNAHNHFPVVDEAGRLIGTVLKRAFAETPPFRMILVDHNETDQGIPGLDELPVVEVADHHRISFTSPPEPIKYTADTVGSTCTIVARMYRGAGLRPVRAVAGVLLAGIVADTLNFQSPTTTEEDRRTAAWLEKLSGEKAGDLMAAMFAADSALAALTPEKALAADRKIYREAGHTFALSQIEESNLARFRKRADAFGAALEQSLATEHLDFAALLVTDPVRATSELIFRGDEVVRRALPWRRTPDGIFLLPGVLSRKKQLVPAVYAALEG